ncbi:MAG: glycosyltransferase [bacterium]|nr:glycosyltransferase [bacterium]
MRVALVYDRVNSWGGAERVLLALNKIFPKAPLYTSVYNPKTAPWAKVFPSVFPSFLQNIPFAKTHHEWFPFLMPLAFESFDFSEFDLVISVTSEAAKGIITKPGTRHICYCLTPTRYLWSGYKQYFKNTTRRGLVEPIVRYLSGWDKVAAQRPDIMIGISEEVCGRIKKYHNRESVLIYPPVELNRNYTPIRMSVLKSTGPYYLVVSRLVPYKKVDLVIDVFNRLNRPLVIVGRGSESSKLQNMAGSNIKFTGNVSDKELGGYYAGCEALIFPQVEDFGIVAVETQLFGKPIIAYKKGGALETVVENKTGVFFDKQTPESLTEAINKFETMSFNPSDCIKNAKRFSFEKFKKEFDTLIFAQS